MKDIGFFDPNLPASYGEGKIVLVGKKLYYRNIILFIKRIKDLVVRQAGRRRAGRACGIV